MIVVNLSESGYFESVTFVVDSRLLQKYLLLFLNHNWYYRLNARTGWPAASIPRLGAIAKFTFNVCHSVAAHPIFWADPSLRYISCVREPTNKLKLVVRGFLRVLRFPSLIHQLIVSADKT